MSDNRTTIQIRRTKKSITDNSVKTDSLLAGEPLLIKDPTLPHSIISAGTETENTLNTADVFVAKSLKFPKPTLASDKIVAVKDTSESPAHKYILQAPVGVGYDPDYVKFTVTQQWDVGTYTGNNAAKFSLKYPEKTVWDDGTPNGSTDDVSIPWSIIKAGAVQDVTVNGNSILNDVDDIAKFTTSRGIKTTYNSTSKIANIEHYNDDITAVIAYPTNASVVAGSGTATANLIVRDVKYDAQGHITASNDRTISFDEAHKGTVTSIKIQTTEPIAGGSATAVTTSGSWTISHKDSGVSPGNYGPNETENPGYGGSFKVPYVSVDAKGHVTSISNHTVNIPASDNTDVNVTQTQTDSATATSTAYGLVFSNTVSSNTNNTTGPVRKSQYLTYAPNTKTVTVANGTNKSSIAPNSIVVTDGTNNTTITPTAVNAVNATLTNLTVDKINGVSLGSNPKFTDTIYTLPAATTGALGGIKIGYTQTGKNYPVQLDSNSDAFVNVPWTDADTKNTAGSTNNTSKLFLIGATSQVDNSVTYSHSSVYETNGALTAASVSAATVAASSSMTVGGKSVATEEYVNSHSSVPFVYSATTNNPSASGSNAKTTAFYIGNDRRLWFHNGTGWQLVASVWS